MDFLKTAKSVLTHRAQAKFVFDLNVDSVCTHTATPHYFMVSIIERTKYILFNITNTSNLLLLKKVLSLPVSTAQLVAYQ